MAAAQEAEEEAAAERQKAVATDEVAATCAARDAAAAAASPLETPSWLLRTYMSRKARFPHAVGSLTHAPNSLHSFPSFDAAAAGCLLGAILMVSSADDHSAGGGIWLITTWCALAMLGRVAFFAPHQRRPRPHRGLVVLLRAGRHRGRVPAAVARQSL